LGQSVLIKKCKWIITQDKERKILKNKSIYIENGLITEISEKISVEADYIINGENKICIPGLINLHTHSPMSLLRGYADDMPLMEWLEKKIWPIERKLTPKLCYLGALLSCLEMIRTGTTFFVDMYWHPLEIAKAANQVGLKALIMIGVLDNFNSDLREKSLKEIRHFLSAIKQYYPNIRGGIGTHAPYTCSPELLLSCKELALKENIPIQIHLAETRREQVEFEKKYGRREVEYLASMGFLSRDVKLMAVHCVWLSKNEISLLREYDVSVVHCPISNMKLAVGGVMPLIEMLRAGIKVGLGTDGPASNNSLDMFQTMKFCALIHKHHRWDPTVANAQLVLDFATINGARILGFNNVLGQICEGGSADIVLLNANSINLQPVHSSSTIISHLVYSACGYNVSDVIVNGRPLLLNGSFTNVNADNIINYISHELEKLFT